MIKFAFIFGTLFPQPQPATPAAKPTPVLVQKRVAAAPTAAEILSGVQKFYASITHVNAKFRQEVVNATFGRSEKSDGTLWIQKPGKMRWDYYGKKKPVAVEKHFISNGASLYVVDRPNKQVIKKDLQKNLLPTAVTFLYGKGDLAADFTPELDKSSTFGAKTDHVLKLTPKAPSAQYKHLYLVVDPATFKVKESIIIDSANNKNHFKFYELNTKATVKDEWFEFNEKSPMVKNYRIVDGDAPQKTPAQTPPPAKAVP
ncbi:MAG: outer membrane lipoprotein carrier protein LolA [Kofleriaceae bacterium]|nr:MAG: outer membrane lipoprotein carrier protein LolA [Kofleriaceae bacterium]MBZ0236480.1 outer membrane lipoprotein carrier protein LolA [Kofleriaceae bacterium]